MAGEGRKTILILGGTGEARRLADLLARRADLEVVSSLAGRTSEPELPAGEVRTGGFGGADGLAAYLSELRPVAVVDATHPYAELISRNARRACAALGVPRLRYDRAPWVRQADDTWIEVKDIEAAMAEAAARGRRIFVAVGRVPAALFEAYPDHWFLVRSVERLGDMPENVRCIAGKGPFRLADEQELLDGHRIDVIVSKASGGSSVFAKIEAARAMKLPVVLLRRPDPPPGPLVHRADEAVAWLDQLLGERDPDRST
ncbi:MAG: cobalt-precorrin-6A reductase [Geminicoccaceae bacterium]